MTKYLLKLLIIFVLVFSFHYSFAGTVVSQVSSSSTESAVKNTVAQTLGTGLTGQVKFIDFFARSATGSTVYDVYLRCFDDDTYSSATGSCVSFDLVSGASGGVVAQQVTITGNTKTWYRSTMVSNSIILDPAKYYKLVIDRFSGTSSQITWYGSSDCSSYPDTEIKSGRALNSLGVSFPSALLVTPCDLYFDISDMFGTPIGNSIEGTSPVSGATGVDAFLRFEGNYTNDGTYTNVAIIIQDLTSSGFPVQLLVCDLAVVGTAVPFSCSTGGHMSTDYTYNAVLYHDDITDPSNSIQSGNIPFSTGTTYTPPAISDTTGPCSLSHLDNCIKNVFTWAFVPSVDSLNNFSSLTLENSVPFSYIYDVGTIFDELFANGGSLEYAISVPFLGSDLDLISASQISSVPYASTIKTILEYLIYFFTAMTLYRIIINRSFA